MFKSPYNIKRILNIKNTQQTVKKRTIQEPYLSQLKCQGSILIWNSSLHWLSWSRALQAAKFHWPGVPLRFLDHYFPCLGHFRALYLLHYFCRWFRCCIKYLYLPFPRPLWRPWAGGGRVPAEHCIRPRQSSVITDNLQTPSSGSWVQMVPCFNIPWPGCFYLLRQELEWKTYIHQSLKLLQ